MKYKIAFLIVVIFGTVISGVSGNGETGFAVLKVPGSVEGLASMGLMEFFTDDAAALFTSPVSIFRTGNGVSINHVRWYQDSYFNSIAVRKGGGDIAWGIGLRSFGIEGIEIRDKATPEPLGTTGSYYYSFNLAVAKRLTWGVKLGAGAKYLYERHYIESAYGAAFDLSASKDFNKIPVQLSAGIGNLGKMSPLRDKATILPLSIYAAGLFSAAKNNSPIQIRTGALLNLNVPAGQFSVRAGGEFTFREIIISEMGFGINADQISYSAGVGLKMNAFHFHYALSGYENTLGYPQQLSITYAW